MVHPVCRLRGAGSYHYVLRYFDKVFLGISRSEPISAPWQKFEISEFFILKLFKQVPKYNPREMQ